MTDKEFHIFAATIWGEARGELLSGKAAVAHVILNRVARPGWPDRIVDVCLQPKQFSCWNPKDPNRIKCELVNLTDASFIDCLYVALGSLRAYVHDASDGADHYHTITKPAWADGWPPSWSAQMTETARVGVHIFYDSGRRA